MHKEGNWDILFDASVKGPPIACTHRLRVALRCPKRLLGHPRSRWLAGGSPWHSRSSSFVKEALKMRVLPASTLWSIATKWIYICAETCAPSQRSPSVRLLLYRKRPLLPPHSTVSVPFGVVRPKIDIRLKCDAPNSRRRHTRGISATSPDARWDGPYRAMDLNTPT